MSTKKSVFLSTRTVEWITITTVKVDSTPKWSESINATVDQFRHLIKASMPDLTTNEWQIILSTYSGCPMPAHGLPARIASDIMDDMGVVDVNQLGELKELVLKIHSMSQTEQIAILYVVQIFWSKTWNSDLSGIIYEIIANF